MKKGKRIISKINNPKLKVEKIATYIMGWIGSTLSILIHTAIFLFFIIMCFFSPYTQEILLILTTVVSLEAIYLSIFIQMSMNTHGKKLNELQEGVEEIQEDVEDIQENVEEWDDDDEDDEDLKKIWATLDILVKDVKELKKKSKK